MDVTNIHGCHSSLTALQPSTIFPPIFLSQLEDDDSGDESVIFPRPAPHHKVINIGGG